MAGGDLLRFERAHALRWMLLWAVPFVLFMTGGFLSSSRAWWYAAGALWLAGSCGRNAISCGRTHCLFTFALYLVLGILAVGRGFGWPTLSWGIWWIVFAAGTVLAFVPEWLGWRMFRRDASEPPIQER